MRAITQKAQQAFLGNKNFHLDNTLVKYDGVTTEMFLFGNLIATKFGGILKITNAGHKTNTTKERLNSLPGVSIYQRKGEWFLNNEKWDGKWTIIE